MGLSKGARDRALRGITAAETWLGLATARAGKGFVEVSDVGYTRQSIAFGEPVHQSNRSYVANDSSIGFAPFLFDSLELRWWFLIDKEHGDGEVVATGEIDPRMMLDKGGKQYTLSEAADIAGKEALTPLYPRVLAGEGPVMAAGDIVLYIEEEA